MIVEQIKRGIIDNNPKENISILSFEFEMLPQDQVLRSMSAHTQVATRDLLSIDKTLSDGYLMEVIEAKKKIDKYPIYYVDTFQDVPNIVKFIYEFEKDFPEHGLIITIDHILLTKNRLGETEKLLIDNLLKQMIEVKKNFNDRGKKILIIMVSQLNRDLESKERIINPKLHYPTKNDLFGASSVYNGSDYVIITHNPSTISGLGSYYGPPIANYPMGLPV